jgi:hypothetical protein
MLKKLKAVVKQNPEPARGKVGTSPMDPWEAKSGIAEASEEQLLRQYLKSRGINPEFVPVDTKISHSKSGEYLKWRRDHQFRESLTTQHTPFEKRQHLLKKAVHMNKVASSDVSSGGLHKEEIEILEAVDKEDTLTFDIPLMIRMLELAREDVKDDMELHRITERLISIRNKGILTMDDYEFIAGIKKLKEEIEELTEKKDPCWKGYQMVGMKDKGGKKVPNCVPEEKELEEGRMKDIATNADETKRLNKMTTLQKFRTDAAAREKKHADIAKNSDGMTSAIDRLEKHMNKEEVEQIDEISNTTLSSYKDKARTSLKTAQTNRDAAESGKDMSKGFADLHTKSNAIAKKRVKGLMGYMQRKQGMKPTSENSLDPQASTQAATGPGECDDSTEMQKQRSKSARMIKSLYKSKNMKEETYDWEKDDKAQLYGKKPKIKEPGDASNMDQQKPDARIVMSGGTTLTGEKRDEVMVDPLMKNAKPGSQTVFDKPSKK